MDFIYGYICIWSFFKLIYNNLINYQVSIIKCQVSIIIFENDDIQKQQQIQKQNHIQKQQQKQMQKQKQTQKQQQQHKHHHHKSQEPPQAANSRNRYTNTTTHKRATASRHKPHSDPTRREYVKPIQDTAQRQKRHIKPSAARQGQTRQNPQREKPNAQHIPRGENARTKQGEHGHDTHTKKFFIFQNDYFYAIIFQNDAITPRRHFSKCILVWGKIKY